MTSYMKYHQNQLVRYRGIGVLDSTGSRFFKLGVDTQIHTKYFF